MATLQIKTATCKFCRKEIDFVTRGSSTCESADFFVVCEEDGYDYFERNCSSNTETEFYCPECGERVATHEGGAIDLFKSIPEPEAIASGE